MADSAKAVIDSFLAGLGLASLSTWAWTKYTAGESIDQISLELYATPQFKAQYPEYETLAKEGRAVSVAQIQAYRTAAAQMFHQYGLPQGFYDQPSDFANLMGNDVSIAELSQRLSQAAAATYQTDQTTKDELQRLWGVTPGEMTAMWLDPDRALPAIQQRFVAAQASAAGKLSGFGQLTQEEALRVAQSGDNVDQLRQGFAGLAHNQELFNPLNAGEQTFGREQVLGAEFGGDTGTQSAIQKQAAGRVAEFGGQDQFATSRAGVVGVG